MSAFAGGAQDGRVGDPTVKNENLAAEALVTLLAGGSGAGAGRAGRPHVTVVVDEQTLRFGPHEQSVRQTANGHNVPPETVDRLLIRAAPGMGATARSPGASCTTFTNGNMVEPPISAICAALFTTSPSGARGTMVSQAW